MELTSAIMSAKEAASSVGNALDHPTTRCLWLSVLFTSGMMDAVISVTGARRKIIYVAKRVHRLLSRGNGSSVKPSKTELLPLDWSPTTTSCGSETYSPMLQAKSLSILLSDAGSMMPNGELSPAIAAVVG